MDSTNKTGDGVNDQNLEAEREQIEEKHRNEILKLLKSFEFERKDTEARFLEELEKKESELRNLPQGDVVDENSSFSNNVLELEEWSQKGNNEQEVAFEKEKEELLLKITLLEGRLQNKETEDCVSTQNQEEGRLENVNICQSNTSTEMQSSESNTNDTKSLSELQNENKKLEVDLNKSRDQILELKNEIKNLTERLHDIEKLFEDDDIPSDKRDILRQILTEAPRDSNLSNDVFAGPSNSAEDHGKSFDDMFTAVTAGQPHRTNSVLSFQLEELNLENEDLKRRIYELEKKLHRTVEENEIRVTVFNEKLNDLVEKFISNQSGDATKEDGLKFNMVEEINNIRLEKTSSEFLEEYVGIILWQKLTASSPDILDVNFSHELQSLEQVLDVEVFDGRVFDEEMKDEVKQVLRDKERELLVAYTLEKLRDEIRHRGITEMTLEELQKERERDFCGNQAVKEVLKVHLGLSEDRIGQEGDVDANQAVNKILREHLGVKENDDKVLENNPMDVDSIENKSTSLDVESLKAEKDDLERNLQELQDYFEKERQEWQEKLLSPLQGDLNDTEDKDKIIQGLHAQKIIMEQILNTERFHLSRLYYMEMKEELESCLKQQNQFDRSTKIEKERLVDAWKHHAEVGELYQEILSKETENIQNLQINTKGGGGTSMKGGLPNDSLRDELSQERSRIEQQLPVKLELLELQRRRCRDHKAASLILEQAVVAMETAAHEQETLLVSGNYFRRKSSWSSVEDGVDSLDVLEKPLPQLHEAELRNKEESFPYKEKTSSYKEEPSPNSSAEMVETPSRKDDLTDALVKVFEKLLNGQQETNDLHLDSCTSDSELSEVETSSSREVPSDDEGSVKKENTENLKDTPSPTDSPRYTEPTQEPEGHDSETVDNSVPVLFKLPPRIENILNIERFNMSRLLRDEYVDKIRRGRQKLRQVRAKNDQKNGELVSKFQEEVKALLAEVEFGESVETERVVPQRQKLTATPSYDSGIADFVEQDKDEVVKKYKELLEKARRDLNRAHRALRARHGGGDEMKDELAKMKRTAKEAKNDLDELEEKQSDLDHERNVLLEKIKDAQNFASEPSMDDKPRIADSGEVTMLERDYELPLNSAFDSENHEQQSGNTKTVTGENSSDKMDESSVAQNSGYLHERQGNTKTFDQSQVPLTENNVTEGEHNSLKGPATESEGLKKKMDERVKEMENKIQKLCEEKKKTEDEVKELQRKLVTGTGGEEVLNDLQEKLTETNEEKSCLEEKCSTVKGEMLEKDERFGIAMKEKEEEVNELQRKLVSGTGGVDILKELQEKLEIANEEKSGLKDNCTGLKQKMQTLEKEIRKMGEEVDAVQRKSVEGTGAEEIVAELQRKLNGMISDKANVEEMCRKLENEIKEKNKELNDVKEHQQQNVNELQKRLLSGTGGEEILESLQEELQQANGKNFSLEEQISDLQKEIEAKDKTFSDEKKEIEVEINELQRKLVSGTGGEEMLKELQEKLQETKEQNISLEEKNIDLQSETKNNERRFSDEKRKMEKEIIELQKKLVSGTGGEEILAELQQKLEKAKQEKADLQTKCEELEEVAKSKDKELDDEIKEKENEINELQKKLVNGIGGEEILSEVQNKLEEVKEERANLQTKCEDLEEVVTGKDKEFSNELKEKENEIKKLQKKLVSGTGGEEIIAELQTKLEKAKENESNLEARCIELEDRAKAKNKTLSDEIKQKETEISELQRKLVSGTGGEEILDELQNKLKKAKEEKANLQKKTEDFEEMVKAKDKKFIDVCKERETEIKELQKKLVSGTGGEEILAELQEKLKEAKNEKVSLQTKCSELEDTGKAKDRELTDELKEKENEINVLQKKLVSGTGGEEILAELQNKVEKAKEDKADLHRKCEGLKEIVKAKSKEFSDQIKERESEIKELQKKLASGTGGEEILGDLQNKLEMAKGEKTDLQTKYEELEETAKAKDKKLADELNERESEIIELQKNLVSGTGGEKVLAELQDKLKEAKENEKNLEAKCMALEDTVKENDRKFSHEIKEKENEISDLQRKLVSSTGGEKILAELQNQLEKAKKEEADKQRKCEQLEEMVKVKDKEFNDEIKEKENEISDLQKQLVNGTGGEEMLAELQNKLEKAKEEKVDLQTKCEELEEIAKSKDKEFSNEIEGKESNINELQKKIVSGTGGEELLVELQAKLEKTKDNEANLEAKCTELEHTVKAKDKEFSDEIKEKENEISDLQRKLVSGTGGEEILVELQNKLEKAKEKEADLQTKYEDLQEMVKAKDTEFSDEIEEKDGEINDLQKKLVSGIRGEDILADLQNQLRKANEEKAALQINCRELDETVKAKNKAMKDKQNEVNELQKKLVSGIGGEEILAELQDQLEKAKEEEADKQRKCEHLEEMVKAKDKEFNDEIKEKENEISDLQKKLVNGTGGEEMLAELQNKLEKAKEEKVDFQTKCEELEEMAKAKDKEFSDEIEDKESNINELQKKIVSGTGGEELFVELQAKLEKTKENEANLEAKCTELEHTAKAKDKEFSDEIKEKENKISDLQRKLVSGTGGEEILVELQNKLEKAKEKEADLQTKYEDLQEMVKAKDTEFSDEIEEKDGEINDLQNKLVSGIRGEDILADLQNQLRKANEEKATLQINCRELDETVKAKNKAMKDKQNEVNELQKKLVSGIGGEEILAELQDQLEKAKEDEADKQRKCEHLEEMVKAKDEEFNDEIKEKENEISDLQKKLVNGTGGEEMLAELQNKLEKAKEEKVDLQTKSEELEEMAKAKDKEFSDEIEDKESNINELQKKIVCGTGGEELFVELQAKLEKTKENEANLEAKCTELEHTAKAKDKEFSDEIKEKENEISDLQRKLVSGTGGEEILAELQNKLMKAKEKEADLQTKYEDSEEMLQAKDKEFSDEIEEKENEISDLQKKLINGTGGEEMLAELQNKLEKAKEEKVDLQTKSEELEEMAKAKDKEFSDEIEDKESNINELQKKIVCGTGGEELFVELQAKLEKTKGNEANLEAKCTELEHTAKAKDKEFSDEIKEKENEISDLQRKLVSGTGGEEILAELQNKLMKAKEKEADLQTKYEDSEEMLQAKDKEFSDEIKEKENEISDLQKKLINGTGGEEMLAELQNKLEKAKEEKVDLQTKCEELEEMAKAKDKEFSDEIEDKESNINELQKKIVCGTGGEELFVELQAKLEKTKENEANLEAKCTELEHTAKAKDKEFSDEIKEKENEISDLQRKLVSGTGGEEILAELQNKLMKAKEKEADLQTKYEDSEEMLQAKDKEFSDEIKEKDGEINDLQKKLVSGIGGEEILADLQSQLRKAKEKKAMLQKKCRELDDTVKAKDKAVKDKQNEVNELQKKLVSGTGGEEMLAELQNKLEMSKEGKDVLQTKCKELDDTVKVKKKEFSNIIQEKESEINELKKKLVNGTGGEEVLAELQDKLREAKAENATLQARYTEHEDKATTRDNKLANEIKEKENEIQKLHKQLVSGTGSEEMLNGLQSKLKIAKEENARLQAKCSQYEENNTIFNDKIKQKEEEIFDLQRKLLTGSGGKEILLNLQDKLKETEQEKCKLDERCSKLEEEVQQKDKELRNGKKEKAEEVNELQKKLIAGTGGEKVLKGLQRKLNEAEMEKEMLNKKVSKLEDEVKKGDVEKKKEKFKRDEEVNRLQKRLISGTGGEEVLEELQEKLKEAEMDKGIVQEKYSKLNSENDNKEKEIADLQNKLVTGNGGEELLANLQQEIKTLKEKNKNMAIQCDDMEEMNKDLIDEKVDSKKLENDLLKAKKENEKLVEENKSKDNEICELQKSIVNGSGAEELLSTLQDKIRETTERNKILEKNCSDLESIVERDDERCQQEVVDLAEAENQIERLTRDCEEKNREIIELERKLVSGTGGEEFLEGLQNQVKGFKENISELKRKLAKTRKHEIAPKGLAKKENELPYRLEVKRTDKNLSANKSSVEQIENELSRENADNYQLMNGSIAPKLPCDETKAIEEPSYELCLQMIPQITEEKDHWREKYKALRMKVGEQFVDIIPEVWNEETILEEEREEALSQLLELRQEISEKETPVMKTVSEKERIETDLSKVKDELGVCCENLELLRELAEEEELIEKNEKKLVECLRELDPGLNSSPKSGPKDGKSSGVPDDMIRRGSETDALEGKCQQLYNEMEELLAEEQNLENKQNMEKDIAGLVDEKIDIASEIKEIETAINDLRKGLSSQNDLNSYSSYIGPTSQNNQTQGINSELEKIQREINLLQSSYEAPSGQEVNNLVALMKEKSRLEDELTGTDKSLSQLGKRDYEALVKERETQEKVAKKLLELSREKEVVEGELQEVEALAKEKENELLKGFNSELKSKEVSDTPSKKRRGFRKKKSSRELKSEDSGKVSSSEEGSFSEVDLEDPPLGPDVALALTKELGSLIQKKSSLAVRLEGMGKEITAQSLKVEKSLLGVKDDPSGEPSSLGSSYTSIEDLTQSQMSLFDDYSMVDDLSLATNVVRVERVKRKTSRKAPMSKLLKEKSTLEKNLKESQGKVLVQNTKIKNALGEEKDAGKAKEKFVQAVGERTALENELSNICTKIDELASEEGSIKEKSDKKGKAHEKKGGKSLSKNDKRRLLSQRKSLRQQLDNLKKKIENFSSNGEEAGLADFPEMREVGSIGNTVERLRELIAHEAELKHELDRLSRKEDAEILSGSGSSEGTGTMLDNDSELRKFDDKDVYMKGITTDFGIPSKGDDEEGMPTEMLGQLEDRSESSSIVGAGHQPNDSSTSMLTEVNLNSNIGERKFEKDSTIQKNVYVSSQGPFSKDINQSSDQGGKRVAGSSASYSDVVDLLVKEQARKETKLRDLEKAIENEKSGGSKINETERVSKRRRNDLKNKMEVALNKLEQRKAVLDESTDLWRKSNKNVSEPSEALLTEDYATLTGKKDELEKHFVAIEDELNMQTQNGEDLKDISAEYQAYKELKSREEDLGKALDNVNEKLRIRKDWAAMDNPRERDGSTLATSYEDVVKRMSDENLNMTDLIHELDETKETLSKEREITSELLDLIKSRVGDELLEALMRESLHSPSTEMREMGFIGGDGYQELLDKVDNDSVTVEEIIGDYKKVNQFLYKENQKLHENIESLKTKVDEDLFACIADQEPADIDFSKKREISKILENNKTLFEQIVSTNSQNEANDELVLIMEDENKSLKIELEDIKKEKANGEKWKFQQKVDNISIVLDEGKKRKKELVELFKKLEKYSSEEILKEHVVGTEVGISSGGVNELQNHEKLTKEGDKSIQQQLDEIFQEISSRLEEAEELSSNLDIEFERLKEVLAETETNLCKPSVPIRERMKRSKELENELKKEHENQDEPRSISKDIGRYKKENTVLRQDEEGLKQSGGLEGKLKEKHGNQDEESRISEDDRGIIEDNEVFRNDDEGLSRNISSVQDLQKAYTAKLDKVQELQEALKRNLDRKEFEVKEIAMKEGDSRLKEIEKENNVLKKDLGRIERDRDFMKDKLSTLEKESQEIKSKLKEVETKNEELTNYSELRKQVEHENKELNVKTQSLRDEIGESVAKLNEANRQRDEIVEKFENLQKKYKSIEEKLRSVQKEKSELNEQVGDLKNNKEELSTNLNESQKTRHEIAAELENLENDRESLKETITSLEQENEDISARLNKAKENNNDIAKDIEDLELENKSIEELLDLQKKENSNLQEEVRELKNKNVEVVEDHTKKIEFLEEKLGLMENDNKELNDESFALKNENREVIAKLNETNGALEKSEKRLKSLQDLEKENESLKETLSVLEEENNEMIPKMDELEKVKKELEDEVEYLRRDEKDFETLNKKLKQTEIDRKNAQEKLEVLKRENKEVEAFVNEDLNQNTANGVKSALVKYKVNCEKIEQQNTLLKRLQSTVGESFSEKLIDLSTDGLVLKDSPDNPKCLEKIFRDKNTLANILKEFEDDLHKVKQHLGEELFSLIVNKDTELENKESDTSLRMVDELKNGKHVKEIIKEYEDLMGSQASDLETVEHLQKKVNVMEKELDVLRKQRDDVLEDDNVTDEAKTLGDELDVQNAVENENIKSSKEHQNDEMDNEYQELLSKIMEHQMEIEEAGELLREQRVKHEAEKQKMVERFDAEKTNMQRLNMRERISMEKAMQNLINEIVRLKEERNEIRKNNRLEKEKLALAFESERAESSSSNEVMKNEIQEKLEKKFEDDLEKAKKGMEAQETELRKELKKLKTERSDLISKVAEMEDINMNDVAMSEVSQNLWTLKEGAGSKEQVKNEFEEKMNVEKKRFQETLNSLRQEIDKLQSERRKAMNEISTKQEDQLKQMTDLSTSEAHIYERLASEFKAKTSSEKMFMESRIKELRKENEVLNQQKHELKSSMRMEKLEMSRKHEREKEELAEKYRNELKSLRKNLEKTKTSQEPSTLPTQNFYELRRKIHDRDTKIKRYETFFKELNQEASILQRDSDMAV